MANRLIPGVVSLALRKYKPADIVSFVQEANLPVIEWSALAHNPMGKEDVAKELATITSDAGLNITAYHSQTRIGDRSRTALPLERELAAAVALGATTLRAFVGNR